MSRTCDSIYGCDAFDVNNTIDGWDYCDEHYQDYLKSREQYRKTVSRHGLGEKQP